MKEYTSLTALIRDVKAAIAGAIPQGRWVRAEISEMSVNYAGHCFLELIDRDEGSDVISAKSRATIWASLFRMIQAYFEASTGQQLEKGLKVLVKASVEMHEVYGLSLNITDIDPSFTVGEQELERRRIIKRLEDEGIVDMNKSLELPPVLQRVAIISSETAAGLGDFMHQLRDNPAGIRFHTCLFPCAMQGQHTAGSIIKALDEIFAREDDFDAVVIIRGGGSKSDLAWFDNYDLAANIAQFPLPVITGIGHERDVSIADLVSRESLKTPTAVAGFILERAENYERRVDELYGRWRDLVTGKVDAGKATIHEFHLRLEPAIAGQLSGARHGMQGTVARLANISATRVAASKDTLARRNAAMRDTVARLLSRHAAQLDKTTGGARSALSRILLQNGHRIDLAGEKAKAFDHNDILSRGYTLTLDGERKVIRSARELEKGRHITTLFADGEASSEVL